MWPSEYRVTIHIWSTVRSPVQVGVRVRPEAPTVKAEPLVTVASELPSPDSGEYTVIPAVADAPPVVTFKK